jgi:quercetin dioxygenase-like cupin family protein
MSVIHKFNAEGNQFKWEGVAQRDYADSGFEGVVKHVLIGSEDGAPNFVVRYFQVAPGKSSRLEQHPHEHGVIILQGRAKVQINDEFFEVGANDAVFISGNDLHQLTTLGEEPLGFICVIPRKDR